MRVPRFTLSLLVLALRATAQTATPEDIGTRVERIVTDAMRGQQIPAMSVAVAREDHIVYSHAFGSADLENDVSASTETLMRTASIAKPISAAAAMTLVDAGKLDLDAPASVNLHRRIIVLFRLFSPFTLMRGR
jgi:CubicO group peptidase (beta-lactamase class C family)